MERNTSIGAIGGVCAVLAIAFVFALFPAESDDTIILVNKQGNDPVNSCAPGNGLILAQNLTDLCDVVIISPTTNQIIKYNGSHWINISQTFITTNTTCTNLGNEIISKSAYICADDTDNILSFKNIVRGDGIGIDFNGTSIIVQNNSPESSTCVNATALAGAYEMCEFEGDLQLDGEIFIKLLDNGTGITMSDTGEIITITNSAPESTVCANLGSSSSLSEGIYVSGNCNFKKLLEGSSIELSSNSTHITITNTAPDNTVCANVGSGTQVYKDGECNFRTIIGSADISITNTTNTVVIDYNGTHVTQVTSNNNNTIGVVPTTGNVVLYPKYELLCQTTLSSSNATISCNNFSARKNLFVTFEARSTGGTGIEPALRFNGDSGTNYAFRLALNGGAEGTATNTNRCQTMINSGALLASGNGGYGEYYIYNNQSGDRKLFVGQATTGLDTTDTTAPTKLELSCKWDNTSAQITSITAVVQSGTGSYNTESQLTVWGYN